VHQEEDFGVREVGETGEGLGREAVAVEADLGDEIAPAVVDRLLTRAADDADAGPLRTSPWWVSLDASAQRRVA